MQNKKCKAINLTFAYSRDEFWGDYPNYFSSYERHSFLHENEIVEAFKKRDLYQSLGYLSLSEEANRDLKEIKQLNELYHGFHQIKVTSAAIILAKFLNFCFNKDGIFVSNNSILLKYNPFVCPINEIENSVPPEIIDKTTLLEKLPDGNPIFDLFALVVPTCCKDSMSAEKDYKNILSFYIKNKIFKSILIGEKNNKFYFIDLVL